jgi:hypothetical protein
MINWGSATRRVAKKVAGGRSPRRPPGRRNQLGRTPEGCQIFRGKDLKHSFVDELRELLNAAGIEFDEKYLS